MFHVSPFIGHCVDRIEEILNFKTGELVKLLAGHYPPKLWISGPAGSGKTMLLLEMARSLLSSIMKKGKDEKILVVCFSSVLRTRLQSILETPWKESYPEIIGNCLHVTTFTQLIDEIFRLSGEEEEDTYLHRLFKRRKKSPEWSEIGSHFIMEAGLSVKSAIKHLQTGNSPFYGMYDHIFVDDGEDMFGSKWPDLLKLMHKSSVTPNCKIEQDLLKPPGYFWVMYDLNQCLNPLRSSCSLPSEYFCNIAELKKVFRNTGYIFRQSKKYFKPSMTTETDITLGHGEEGLPIKWDTSLRFRNVIDSEVSDVIIAHLRDLQSKHVQERDICILVESISRRKSLRRALSLKSIETQSGKGLVENNDNKIVVESVKSFKGLESKVVILVDPRYEDHFDPRRCIAQLLYIAVSRCSCYLIVITTQDGERALKSERGIQYPTFSEFVLW